VNLELHLRGAFTRFVERVHVFEDCKRNAHRRNREAGGDKPSGQHKEKLSKDQVHTSDGARQDGFHRAALFLSCGQVHGGIHAAHQAEKDDHVTDQPAKGGSAAVKRPWLGAKLQEVTPEIAESLGLKRPSGALVANLLATGPAARAGIKTGDLIVSIDGTVVDDPNSFDYRFATKPLGGTAQVALLRQGHDVSVTISLQSAPDTPREEVEIKGRSPFLGATVANLSPALADELRLDAQALGVVVIGVADGSTAQSVGFHKGDIIVSVNNQKIEKSADLDRVTRAGSRQWRVIINRGGQQISAMFSG